MVKIVVTGASGLLGRALMRELAAYEPAGTALGRVRGGLSRLDLLDQDATERFLDATRPEIILHAAAERRPDVSEREPDRTAALNVAATGTLARVARRLGAWMLYLSTDYVFDGTAPPYRPRDHPHPLNLYGQTKLDGERVVLSALPDAAVLRLGILFGQVEFVEESSVIALLQDVRSVQEKTVDDWSQRYPTYIDDVAVLCRQLVERRCMGEPLSGIQHWCGNERFTKYGLAQLIGQILNRSTSHLHPDSQPVSGAPRPRDCELDCSGLERLGLGRRTPVRQALAIALRESAI